MPKGVPNKRYTPEFKKLVIETMQEEKLSYSETCRRFEVNSRDQIKSWERIYLEEGPEGLTVERRGRSSKGRPPKQLPKQVEEDLLADLAQVRKEAGDRAVLRALHFYADDRRAAEEADALERKDKEAFLNLVKESGRSSWELLQNITPAAAITHQDMAVALAVAEKTLNGKGACRVHGGGFAGTIQAFVPVEDVCEFKKTMETMLSEGCCHVLSIRPAGGLIL